MKNDVEIIGISIDPDHRKLGREYVRTEDLSAMQNSLSMICLPFTPSKPQKRILEALNGTSLKTDDLAAMARLDRSELFRQLKELREQGMVLNERRIGFFRPDAPSDHNRNSRNPTKNPTVERSDDS